MKNRINRLLRGLLFTAVLLAAFRISSFRAFADATDAIRNFTVTVDVNEDASLEMLYHIEWEVLDDETYGPLEWIDLGVPNANHENIRPLSDSIDRIEDNGSNLAIWLDRLYKANETVTVEFVMTQDRMYQIDKWVEGETVYTFTPAWFDEIDVDHLEIRWNSDMAGAWQPDCYMEGDYLVFEAELPAGDRYTLTVVYPNDAFGFVPDRQADDGEPIPDPEGWEGGEGETGLIDFIAGILAILVGLGIFLGVPAFFILSFLNWISEGLGFGSGQETEKKITRTKIEYFENCPG